MTDAEAETIKVGILIQSSNDTEKLKAKWALFAASKKLQDPCWKLIKF